MSGAEIIALVSVAGTVATAVLVPWMTNRFGLVRYVLETSHAREEELREHLDLASIRLTEARQAVVLATQPLSKVAPESARSVATQAYNTYGLMEQLAQTRKNLDRIGVRTGSDSAIARAYRDAVSGIQGATNVIARIMEGEMPSKAFGAEIEAELVASNKAQDRFHDAASNVIGVRSYSDAWKNVRSLTARSSRE